MTTISIQPKFFDDARRPGHLQIVADMPELKGSEKQIAWAADIRDAKRIEFAELLAGAIGVKWGVVLQSDVDHIAACQAQLDAFTADATHAASFAQLEAVFSIEDSRFWIDNRSRDMHGMARSAAAYQASR